MVRVRSKKTASYEQEKACYSSATRAFLHWMTLFAATGLLDDFGFGSYKFTRSAMVFAVVAVSVNIFTFLIYALDRALALTKSVTIIHVPDIFLLVLNVFGGVPFAAFAMWLLGHKTGEGDAAFRDRFISSSKIFQKIIRWMAGIVVVIFATYWIQQHEVVPRPMD